MEEIKFDTSFDYSTFISENMVSCDSGATDAIDCHQDPGSIGSSDSYINPSLKTPFGGVGFSFRHTEKDNTESNTAGGTVNLGGLIHLETSQGTTVDSNSEAVTESESYRIGLGPSFSMFGFGISGTLGIEYKNSKTTLPQDNGANSEVSENRLMINFNSSVPGGTESFEYMSGAVTTEAKKDASTDLISSSGTSLELNPGKITDSLFDTLKEGAEHYISDGFKSILDSEKRGDFKDLFDSQDEDTPPAEAPFAGALCDFLKYPLSKAA